MQSSRLLNLLIAICVAAALLSAQIASPLAVELVSPVAGSEMQVMADGSPCSAPCCPDRSGSDDCGSCPCFGLCLPMVTIAAPTAGAALAFRYPLRNAFAIPVELLIEGLGAKPPHHPPRIIV
ncbi:MAG TPA: hypothetical protein VKS24_07895 [Bradyrhizobium sp.]|nr:hypothetical protein [Bradyrhizobium sp.]